MTNNPRVGVTHHVVLHLDTMTRVGVIVTPGTYRVSKKPNLIPRLAVGDPRGLDYGTWWSFVQDDFSGGSGQYYWNKDSGNNRFAESLFMDIGTPGQRVGEVLGGATKGLVSNETLKDPVRWANILAPAVMPTQTSVQSPLPSLFTSRFPAFVFLYSNRPLLVHNQFAALYTNNLTQGDWLGNSGVYRGRPSGPMSPNDVPWRGSPTDYYKSLWVVLATNIASAAILSAVMHSTQLIVSVGAQGLRAFGSTDGAAPAYWHTPAYSTITDLVETFDNRIWRTNVNKLAYLDPATGLWGAYQDVGDSTYGVTTTVTFAGKILMGKPDGLYAYDAGRIYLVQGWPHSIDPSNFAFMKVLRGDLYFNIGRAIYRLSSASTVEKLDWPLVAGVVLSGEVTDEELYVMYHTQGYDTRIFIFNPENGSVREWLRSREISYRVNVGPHGPTSINAAGGALWLSPMYLTVTAQTHSPIASINKLLPSNAQIVPNFHKGGRAYMITSELTMGYPDLDKYWHSAVIDYNLNSPTDRFQVYFLPEIKTSSRIVGVLAETTTGVFTNLTSEATDGGGGPDGASTLMTFTALSAKISFGFSEPISSIYVDIVGQGKGWYFGGPRTYWNGAAWRILPMINAPPQSDGTTTWYFAAPQQLSWVPPDDWAPSTVNGITAYWVRAEASTGSYNWQFRLYEVSEPGVANNVGAEQLEAQPWQLLGTITNSAANRAELLFPNDIISRTMMLKFVAVAGGSSRPELKKFRLKYMPVGPDANLLRISFAAQAINNIKLLDGSIENNAQGIAAAAFSMIGANKPYVVELPWPPPVGHTRRAKILLGEPGAQIPIMTFDNTLGVAAAPEASIPIIIEQV